MRLPFTSKAATRDPSPTSSCKKSSRESGLHFALSKAHPERDCSVAATLSVRKSKIARVWSSTLALRLRRQCAPQDPGSIGHKIAARPHYPANLRTRSDPRLAKPPNRPRLSRVEMPHSVNAIRPSDGGNRTPIRRNAQHRHQRKWNFAPPGNLTTFVQHSHAVLPQPANRNPRTRFAGTPGRLTHLVFTNPVDNTRREWDSGAAF